MQSDPKKPRTIEDEVDHPRREGSMLDFAIKTNPDLANFRKPHRRNVKEQVLYEAILATPREFFGEHPQTGQVKFRPGTKLEERLENFLAANPHVPKNHFIEYAVHRLLKDLGE